MRLTYRSFVHAVASLRGPVVDPIEPTAPSIPYRGTPLLGVAPLADVYVPRHATGASTLLVHGGAFVFGSRRMKSVRYLAARLADAGVSVCAIDYRLLFRGGGFVEALDDVHAALAFWRDRVDWLRLDPTRISIIGLSAGGTLALLAAARDAAVARVVGCFGLYELRSLRLRVHTSAPTLLLHGDGDGIVPVEQSRRLAAKRAALGLPTRLVVYPGAPHGFFTVPSYARDEGVREIIEHVR